MRALATGSCASLPPLPSRAPARRRSRSSSTRPSRSSRTAATARWPGRRRTGIMLGQSDVAPHSMLDPSTKEASGIDVEINEAVLDWLGVEKRHVSSGCPGASQIPSLLSKRTDVIAQNIHVNPERVKVISFTGPAWWYGPVVLVEKGNPDGIKSYDDLKGKTWVRIARLGRRGLSAPDRRADPALQVRGRGAAEPEPGPGQVRGRGRRDLHRVRQGEPGRTTSRRSGDIADPGRHHLRRRLRRRALRHPQGGLQLRDRLQRALGELRNNGFVSAVLKKYGLSDRNLVWFKLQP